MSNKNKSSKGKHAAATVVPVSAPAGESFQDSDSGINPVQAGNGSSKKKAGKVVGIVFAVIFGLLAIVYLAGSIFFMNRFWPNTMAGSTDLSLMTAEEAGEVFTEKAKNYSLTVKGQGLSFTVTSEDAQLLVDGHTVVSKALDDNSSWLWPVEIFKTHDETEGLKSTDYTQTNFGQVVVENINTFNAEATQPTSATVAFDQTKGSFAIAPEIAGTALDTASVMDQVNKAILTLEPQVSITEEELIKPLVVKEDPALKTACDTANTMISANLTLVAEGNEIGVVGPVQIAPWIKLTPGMTIEFDEAAMKVWVTDFANSLNTVGAERTYTRPDGKVITVKGGTYGWQIDSETLATMIEEGILTGKTTSLDVPVLQAGNGFVSVGGQDWGKRYCDIDLAEQYARFYDANGALIWESPIVTGIPDGKHDTPSGVYVLNSKASPSTLVGEPLTGSTEPEYRTKVSYWMPFVGNAIGLHDATWQSAFGGSRYRQGYGSHGCVNLPLDQAAAIYEIIQIGDVVVAHW